MNLSNIQSGDKYLPTFIYMKNGQPLDPYEYTKMNIQAVLANCSKKGPANDGIKTEVTAIKDSSDNEEDTNEKEGIVEEWIVILYWHYFLMFSTYLHKIYQNPKYTYLIYVPNCSSKWSNFLKEFLIKFLKCLVRCA